MNNKHFMRNLRLTMPAHYAGRRSVYMRPEPSRGWERALLVICVVALFVGGLPW